MTNYIRLTTGIIAVWFAAALTAGALHGFENSANRIGASVAVAAVAPIVLFLIWYAVSARFREFALSLNPVGLTYAQTPRVAGIVFVILALRGVLPKAFGYPAGYGDFFIGLTAPLVAWKLANAQHRASFVIWQLLGIADLVNAVAVGITVPLLLHVSMGAMTALPLSLIPTFGVPLYLIWHLISLFQAKSWGAAGRYQVRRDLAGAPTGLPAHGRVRV